MFDVRQNRFSIFAANFMDRIKVTPMTYDIQCVKLDLLEINESFLQMFNDTTVFIIAAPKSNSRATSCKLVLLKENEEGKFVKL